MEWSKLFFSVWKNIYLNKQIFIQLGLLNDNMNKSFKIEELKEYKYKEYIQKVIITDKFSNLIVKGDLPNSGYLKYILFKSSINLTGYLFPDGIEHICLSFLNKQSFELLCNGLPKSVTSIQMIRLMESDFLNYKRILNTTNIKQISFGGGNYNSSNIKLQSNIFPNSIKILKFPDDWNNGNCKLKIGDIPNGIEELDIGSYSNEIDIGILPNSITSLIISHPFFGYKFKSGSFPNKIKKLVIYTNRDFFKFFEEEEQYDDNKCIIDIDTIPNSIIYLEINTVPIEIYQGSLPNSLKTFVIDSTFLNGILESNVLPPFLESLFINFPTNIKCLLPNTLTTFHYNLSISNNSLIDTSFLSNLKSLTELRLSNIHSISIGYIPINNSIRKLELFFSNQEFELGKDIIPISKVDQKLVLVGYSNKLKINDLPNTITSLSFDTEYQNILENDILPIGLLELELPYHYNLPIRSNVLPITLTSLNGRNSNFNQQLSIDSLPINLKSLILDSYDHPISSLPSNLEFLQLLSINHKITCTIPQSLKILVLNENLGNKTNSDLSFLFGDNYKLPSSLIIKYCKFK